METEYGILGPLSDDEYKRHYFWFSFAMSQIFGLFVMLVAGFWAALYAGGDSLPMYRKNDTVHHHSSNGVVLFEPYPSFQFHVFFMPYAMVFLVGEGQQFEIFFGRLCLICILLFFRHSVASCIEEVKRQNNQNTAFDCNDYCVLLCCHWAQCYLQDKQSAYDIRPQLDRVVNHYIVHFTSNNKGTKI